ncbi:MAG TPA: L-threonylcarbamoyladenylate synthase [Thermoanaerobaculia bacterium]
MSAVRGAGRGAVRRWRFGGDSALPAAVVSRGGVLAIPTESSYGLAADPRSVAGVEAIYRLKSRETGKPLPVVIAGVEQLALVGVDPESPQSRRAARCWPAALTVVLPFAPGAPPLPAAAGGTSVAVRVPDHAELRALLAATGPLTATSANPAGGEPILDPAAVADLLAAAPDALLVDGGTLPGGPASTLVAFEGRRVRLLRPGRMPAERAIACLEG